MKFATFRVAGSTTWGLIEGGDALDIGAVLRGRLPDLKSAIVAGALHDVAQHRAQASRYPVTAIEWLPVIPNPDKILCVGLNYAKHRQETGRAEVENPTIFARYANSQTGHLADIIRPHVSVDLDFEGELAVIIGKAGRHVSTADALKHVAGYACYNDASVRDFQHHTSQFTPGRNFPGTGAFGPYLVTPDKLGEIGCRLAPCRGRAPTRSAS